MKLLLGRIGRTSESHAETSPDPPRRFPAPGNLACEPNKSCWPEAATIGPFAECLGRDRRGSELRSACACFRIDRPCPENAVAGPPVAGPQCPRVPGSSPQGFCASTHGCAISLSRPRPSHVRRRECPNRCANFKPSLVSRDLLPVSWDRRGAYLQSFLRIRRISSAREVWPQCVSPDPFPLPPLPQPFFVNFLRQFCRCPLRLGVPGATY